ncbi:MAG: hypothetical protein NTW94_08370 [Legionellales bacterium]|nr:hypothetical protein [Legionellales bacterium]
MKKPVPQPNVSPPKKTYEPPRVNLLKKTEIKTGTGSLNESNATGSADGMLS